MFASKPFSTYTVSPSFLDFGEVLWKVASELLCAGMGKVGRFSFAVERFAWLQLSVFFFRVNF